MATAVPKSFLLGGQYDWRTAAGSAVNDDPTVGLSLKPTLPITKEPPAPPPGVAPAFVFSRLSYDIDREKREVRAYTSDGRLRHRWVSRDANGDQVAATDDRAWDPVDIAGDDSCVFVLDQRYQSVYVHLFGRETLSLIIRSQDSASQWKRLALDQAGCLLIFIKGKPALVYDRHGKKLGTSNAEWPPLPLSPENTSTQDSNATTTPAKPLYPKEGAWLSKSLDSSVYNCTWHRIEMIIDQLPPGTQIEVRTFAYKQLDEAPNSVNDGRLVLAHTVVAPTQPPPEELKKKRIEEFLVQSSPGQFLTVLIRLVGDGFGTPVIKNFRVHYPRESYLEYLPPLYSASEPMRVFLERFLAIFQTEWDGFERRVDQSEAFFDPDAVPEGNAMEYLASWLDLELEGSWQPEQNRKLLQAVPKIYPHRGTVGALRDYVGVYLANMARLTVEQISQTGFPAFVEGFQERQFLLLSQTDGSRLGEAKPLWGAAVVKRLQLGVFAREGEVELVSTGEPELDLFNHFAHRFRVYVPAAWVRTADQEQLLRRAIEAEMPAHVSYELCLIDAGVKVDMQSTVGLDMIIGDPPACRLTCEPDRDAPSLPLHNRLGFGAVLATRPKGSAVLDDGARVGDWILN
jgi:phage tail-like protein